MPKLLIHDIQAYYLIPAYQMTENCMYVATQHSYDINNSIDIDVWLVNATKENTKKSMIESLDDENKKYFGRLYATLLNANLDDEKECEKFLYYSKMNAIFYFLSNMARRRSSYRKKPDPGFVKIAQQNLATPALAKYNPDVARAVYFYGYMNDYEF